MSFSMIMLTGNIGKQPEIKYMASGMAVLNFSLAINDNKKTSSDEWIKETSWFRITAFGKLAERMNEKLHAGSHVEVVAKPKMKNWKDKEGNKRVSLENIASYILILDKKPKNQLDIGIGDKEIYYTEETKKENFDCDIPF